MVDHAQTQYASKQMISGANVDEHTSRETALVAARAADDRKADNILVLCVSEVSYLADYFVIVTGFSQAQLRGISQDVIVHILLPQGRDFYKLEAFWGHAERVNWQSD
jgi:ribosome-associated protein